MQDSEIKEAKVIIVKSGDKNLYASLCIYYYEKGEYESTLPYSLVMAYKYNDRDAYYNIYRTMIQINNGGEFNYETIKKLDKTSKEFALQNLIKSANLGCNSAKNELEKYHLEGTLKK
ncbi:hypothetical protein [Flavobacterium tructae]|uniref:hypothetical protein n=1 Tax=Flavobacterium tructae TaxID=1114873 RepID=UPI0013F4C6F8|nr:hypothetical protein [Flavobacterium tructae]